MLNTLFGWYANQQLGVKFSNIRFKETLLVSTTPTTITLADEIDASTVKSSSNMSFKDFFITSVFSYVTPGSVSCKVVPDNEISRQFFVEASSNPYTLSVMPPKLCEVDLVIDLINNDAVPNTVYLDFSVMWISQDKLAEFTNLSSLIPDALAAIDNQTHDANTINLDIRDLIAQLIEIQGGTPSTPWSGGYTPVRAVEPCKEFCKRRGKK
jgi:hypothetical protein